MKCPECDGTGKVVHPMMSMNGDEYTGEWEQHECEMCGGTGELPMTNEEWFCSLPTGEKAHFLSVECARAMCEQQLKITNRNTVDYWKMWLKQPHTEKE